MVKETQRDKVLKMLKRKRWVTSSDFYGSYIPRFAARIYDLKQDGYNIQREYWRDGMYKYWLVEERLYEND